MALKASANHGGGRPTAMPCAGLMWERDSFSLGARSLVKEPSRLNDVFVRRAGLDGLREVSARCFERVFWSCLPRSAGFRSSIPNRSPVQKDVWWIFYCRDRGIYLILHYSCLLICVGRRVRLVGSHSGINPIHLAPIIVEMKVDLHSRWH